MIGAKALKDIERCLVSFLVDYFIFILNFICSYSVVHLNYYTM